MELELRYVWDSDKNNPKTARPKNAISELDSINKASMKKDIAYMVVNGCSTKKLKSKMRKLKALNKRRSLNKK